MRRVLLTAGSAIVIAIAALAAFMLKTDASPIASDGHPSYPSDGMRLAFSDEFDATTLDGEKWHTCFWWAPRTCAIETHDDAGLYTASNVSVADGVLTLRARREQATGWNGTSYDYTTGMISTGGSSYSEPRKKPGFTFTYGYVEARIKVPAGQGLFPAFWLPMADHSWPPEVDIMEILGHDPTRTTMHYHYRRPNGTHGNVGQGWKGPDFSAGWHTFGVDWEPGSLVWYVDGVKRAKYTDPGVTDQPAYLVLNLGVGGTWVGSPDDSTPLPADMAVDYVRVYQRPSG